MDQVKKGFKTLLDCFFEHRWLKNVSQIKDQILLCPGQVRKTRAMLHRPPKSANHLVFAVTKNRGTTILHQNDSSDQKKPQKMTFNTQWLEKYSGALL